MIRDGYGLKPEEINIAVEWLKLNPPNQPVALDQAVKLGKRGPPAGNQNASKNKVDNINFVSVPKTKGGTGRDYILARLQMMVLQVIGRPTGHAERELHDVAPSRR
jgi:hypothetical protein